MASRSPRATSRACAAIRPCSRPISGGAPRMLKLTDIVTYYGPIPALKGVTLEVKDGEIVCLLGGNASGKSTTMKTILGLVRPHSGSVDFEGKRLDRLATADILRRTIPLVPHAPR